MLQLLLHQKVLSGFLFFQPAARDDTSMDESWSSQGRLRRIRIRSCRAVCRARPGAAHPGPSTHRPKGRMCPQWLLVPHMREEGMAHSALPVPRRADCTPLAGWWEGLPSPPELGPLPLTEDALHGGHSSANSTSVPAPLFHRSPWVPGVHPFLPKTAAEAACGTRSLSGGGGCAHPVPGSPRVPVPRPREAPQLRLLPHAGGGGGNWGAHIFLQVPRSRSLRWGPEHGARLRPPPPRQLRFAPCHRGCGSR